MCMQHIFKTIFIILILQCGGEVLGMNENNDISDINIINNSFHKDSFSDSKLNNKEKDNTFILDSLAAIFCWKLGPITTTWRKQLTQAMEYFYGMSNGIVWYLIREENWKIGLFCLEHRSWEIIPKLVHLCKFSQKDSSLTDVILRFIGTIFAFPLACSFFSLQWKYLRINMFSIFEIINYCCNFTEFVSRSFLAFFAPFFSEKTNEYFCEKTAWLALFFLLPRLSINMSFFAKDQEDEFI